MASPRPPHAHIAYRAEIELPPGECPAAAADALAEQLAARDVPDWTTSIGPAPRELVVEISCEGEGVLEPLVQAITTFAEAWRALELPMPVDWEGRLWPVKTAAPDRALALDPSLLVRTR